MPPPSPEPATATTVPAASGKHTLKRILEQVDVSWADILPTPKKVHRFDCVNAMVAVLGRLEKHGLKKEADGPAEVRKMVIEQHPPYEFTKFFVDEQEVKSAIVRGESLSTVPMYSVPTKAMADEMKKRNYILLRHCPIIDWGDMPTGASAVPAEGGSSSGPQAPLTFRMASRVPDVRGATAASQVVCLFERVAVIQVDMGSGEMRDEIYSPLRLWTPQARRAAPLAANQPTRFSALCKIYAYIRAGLCRPPEEIDTAFGKLRSDASAWGRGEADEEWFERAVREYDNLHT